MKVGHTIFLVPCKTPAILLPSKVSSLFNPINSNDIKFYVCGPTVYERAHIGNARPAVVFDILFRFLQEIFGPKHVTYVRNFTDIDDKINKQAMDTGRSIGSITDETIQWYKEDMSQTSIQLALRMS